MLVQKKVQLNSEDVEFIEKICQLLNYKSKSEYMRLAIVEKIKADKKKFRELQRQIAMEGYKEAENLFESLEGEDFEDR